ncbi:hypothetical protein F2Q69_00017776 [Brassica cretica]|uniref:Protein kinase domain-containing protein n=1 Tax=Brassica cretica TaxID=69181 RepID=A0A8S9QTS6_BRACR|nr:hypothetical protein F2Q69_00017776 [Brassica cretica]
MFNFLKGVVGGSGTGLKDLPYNVGDPYPSAWGSWIHHRGTSKDDGSQVSIFALCGNNAQDGHLAAGRNGVKRLRTVRHPNILSFLHSTEVETHDGSTSKVTIYIVTEPVMPLSDKIKELGLKATQRDEYFALGLHQITKAVSFLNNDCKLVHGNVCLASVVVTPTLDWKLHAFDVLSEFDGSNGSASGPMLVVLSMNSSRALSWEKQRSCVTLSAFLSLNVSFLTVSASRLSATPKFHAFSQIEHLKTSRKWRLNVSFLTVSASRLSATPKFHAFSQIEHLKTSRKWRVEKDTFFRKLPNVAEQLPREIVLKKLLPLLASSLEFGSAVAPALTALLKMGSWLSTEDFKVKVLPTIVKLFASNDRAIRVSLLQHVDQFGESMSGQIVDEQVYPHVATGFADTSTFLRELTLKSMLVLAPKLSQRTLSGSLLKYLSKLQVDEEPAIRTNTTILLGNITTYLNEGTRKRVLINAFTVRALRDTFPPARGAGIVALCATSTTYDDTEIATKILPNVVVLTIDQDSEVRSKAFQAVEQFLQILKQNYEKTNAGETGATGGASAIPETAGLIGWAMSSLTLKGKPLDQAPLASSSSAPSLAAAAAASNAPSTVTEAPSVRASHHTRSNSDFTDQPAPPSPSSTDGWENGITEGHDSDNDGWDLDPIDEPKPSPALSNIQAAQKRPVSQPSRPAATSSRPKISTAKAAAKSEDDDLWGSIAAPQPATTSRPLNLKKTVQSDDEDPWAAIAAPPPTTRAKPLSSGRGRAAKPAAPKLGAQRINRTSSGM